MLVAWPDVLPYAGRVSRWLRFTTRRVVNRLLRAIGRPRAQHVQLGVADEVSIADSVSVVVSVSADASLEEKVGYLLRREQESQNAHDERLRAIEDSVPKQLDELRAETERHVSEEISAAEWQYRPLRFVGALALAVGLLLMTIANFL